jgi:hypothetical protein
VLNLDHNHSTGISETWPKKLSNEQGENKYTFQQGFNAQIKFSALYYAPNNASISLVYYADAIQRFNANVISNPSNAFEGTSYGAEGKVYDPVFTISGKAVPPNF